MKKDDLKIVESVIGNSNTFKKSITNQIKRWHSFMTVPVSGVPAENLLHQAILDNGGTSNWMDNNSHKSGADLNGGKHGEVGVSQKTGKITKSTNTLTISGSRTTSYDGLDNKINFFDGKCKNFDFYLTISRIDTKKKKKLLTREYRIFVIPADAIKASSKKWTAVPIKNSDKFNYISDSENGLMMRINEKMSGQFWMYIKLDEFPDIHEIANIKFNAEDLGKDASIKLNKN